MIKYKKSLNMPRGKIIAQASHALGAFVLGCFDFEKNQFKCEPKALQDFVKNIKLQAVDDEEFDNTSFLLTIQDHGRTVFKGVPTVTCGIVVLQQDVEKFKYHPNEHEDTPEINVRLIQVVDKQFARKDFDYAMQRCVVMQSLHLIEFMQKPQFVQKEDFMAWAKGSFAKIVLVGKDDFLKELKDKNLNLDITWDGLDSCVIGPLRKEYVNEHTNTLKMM